MRHSILLFIIQTLILKSALSDWVPTSPLNLGTFSGIKDSGLMTCQLSSNKYVSIRKTANPPYVNHFTWDSTGTKSETKFLNEALILDLLCLKNGQYLIITGDYSNIYDNFTFSFFNENGNLASSFKMNDTSLIINFVKAFELSETVLMVYSPQPSDLLADNVIGLILLISHTGTVLKRREIPFNTPPGFRDNINPTSYAYMMAITDENSKIILAMNLAEFDIIQNVTNVLYEPQRTHYNITIFDSNLDIEVGPVKTYNYNFQKNFKVNMLGSDKIVFSFANKNNKTMTMNIFDTQLNKIYTDSYNLSATNYLFDQSNSFGNDGFVLFGQSNFNSNWQEYNYNTTRRGPLVKMDGSLKYLGTLKLKNTDEFGLMYYNSNSEVLFTKGLELKEVINFGHVLQVGLMFLAFIVIIL